MRTRILERAALLLLAAFICPSAVQGDQATQPPKRSPIPVLIDTDIGDDIDDAFALALALKSPELEVRSITTVFGDAHTRALLARRFLEAVGSDNIPVASGRPARAKPEVRGQLQYGVRANLRKQPEKETAVDFLYQQLKARPGLTLIAIGPLTNVRDLIARHPDCKPWIKRLVLMAGAVRVGYNGQPPPVVEWNVRGDVKAAQAVFQSGIPLVVAPLDATVSLKLGTDDRRRIFQANNPLGRELHALYKLWGNGTPVLFDPLAVALCFDERFCKMEDLCLRVDSRGFTRLTDGKPNARVATSVQRDEFLLWFTKRLTQSRR